MVKRIAIIPVWFVAIWLMYGLVAYFVGVPDSGGAILGVLTAAFVATDPTGAFWGRKGVRAEVTSGRKIAGSPPARR